MSVDPERFTLADFIAWEQHQARKHEFRAGAVYALAGATDDHNVIVGNLLTMIRPVLRGGPCRIYANDMKLVTVYPASRYPDLMVTCDARDAQNSVQKRYPKLVIEVLSESTAGVDSGDKLDEYQTIGELEEYVLVDSRKPSIRVYARNGAKFETGPAIISGDLRLGSLGLVLGISDIYEDVNFSRISI